MHGARLSRGATPRLCSVIVVGEKLTRQRLASFVRMWPSSAYISRTFSSAMAFRVLPHGHNVE